MTTTTTPLNGVNIEAILGARQALTEAPAAASFQWRAEARWVDGTYTETKVERFFGLGEEQQHVQAFTYGTDHPEVFASKDRGSTPAEMLLVALAGCLGAGIASVAANRGIRLRSVNATVTGDMDIQGIMGIDRDVRNGFTGITVSYEIDADASPEEIEGIVTQSQRRSAVYDAVSNPTSIKVEVV